MRALGISRIPPRGKTTKRAFRAATEPAGRPPEPKPILE